MAEIFDFDPTDANNTGRWPEGMLGGQINDAGRADEGILARWYRDLSGDIDASGSSNAFAITSNRTITLLFDPLQMVFTANHTITGPATLDVNGLGAKSIKRFNGNDLAAGDIVSGQPVWVLYKLDVDAFYMLSAPAALTGNMFVDLDENGSPGNPAVNAARLYAQDDAGDTILAWRDNAGTVNYLKQADAAAMEGAEEFWNVPVHLQHRHPLHPKGTVKFSASGGAISGVVAVGNISGVVRNSTGRYTISFSPEFSNTDYTIQGTASVGAGARGVGFFEINGSRAVGSIQVGTDLFDDGNAPFDPVTLSVMVLGDL